MEYQEFIDKFEGSFLRRDYLEAFVLQFAYIESLLNFLVWLHTYEMMNHSPEANEGVREEILRRTERMTFKEMTDFLRNAGVLDNSVCNGLDHYRDVRNKTLHQILIEKNKDDFQVKLREAFLLGKTVVDGPLKHMVEAMRRVDEGWRQQRLEANGATDQSKLQPSRND